VYGYLACLATHFRVAYWVTRPRLPLGQAASCMDYQLQTFRVPEDLVPYVLEFYDKQNAMSNDVKIRGNVVAIGQGLDFDLAIFPDTESAGVLAGQLQKEQQQRVARALRIYQSSSAPTEQRQYNKYR
jgi:hypothetical protein